MKRYNENLLNLTAMGKVRSQQRISGSKIDEAINLLKEQKPKERDDVSAFDAVRKMRRYIEKLTSKKYGYSYDEVSEMLKGLGINLSGNRIKTLLAEVKKNTSSKKKAEPGLNSGVNESVLGETQNLTKNGASADTKSVLKPQVKQ